MVNEQKLSTNSDRMLDENDQPDDGDVPMI
jgi:hypothetical protein